MTTSTEAQERILLIEADDDICGCVGGILDAAGFAVELATTAETAFQKVKGTPFDLILIDRVLPETTGLEVVRTIRKSRHHTPILFLTSATDPEQVLEALSAGVDDYLQIPFDRIALLTRVRSLLRSFKTVDLKEIESRGKITLGKMVIDLKTDDVFCDTDRVQLTPSEFKLLHALARHRGVVLTRERLIELVQGAGIAVIDRAIDTHVFGLRKKLGTHGEIIETVRGVGYRIGGV